MFDLSVSEKEVIQNMKENGLSAVILQPFPGAPDPREVHERIYKMTKEYPGKIFGLVNLNPHMDDDAYVNEVERLVKDYHFVGLKIHTAGHALNPLGNDAKKVFEAAKRLRVPLMIHTGVGIPWASPALVLPRAMEYPNVKMVLAHAGYGFVIAPEAYAAAKIAKNVYLETSWDDIYAKSWFINMLGPEKVMLGSDIPMNTSSELYQYRALNLPEEVLEKCLYETAKNLFDLEV